MAIDLHHGSEKISPVQGRASTEAHAHCGHLLPRPRKLHRAGSTRQTPPASRKHLPPINLRIAFPTFFVSPAYLRIIEPPLDFAFALRAIGSCRLQVPNASAIRPNGSNSIALRSCGRCRRSPSHVTMLRTWSHVEQHGCRYLFQPDKGRLGRPLALSRHKGMES